MTDPSVVSGLTAFKRDLLYAVRALERDGEAPKGLAIKDQLETEYGEKINHSRLYQNLDGLIEDSLLTKGRKDDRTNEYATTETARELLEAQTRKRVEQVGLETNRSTKRRNETCSGPTASLLPDADDATVLFDGEEMDADELSEGSGTWTRETEIGQVEVTFEWNADFFTHASALVGPDEELVALDFESSYSPGIDPVFVPTNDQYDFKIELLGDDGSSDGD
jgi:DNA-binding PadR family transcriptional regulator